MTRDDAWRYLRSLGRLGLHPGLDTTRRLAAAAGNPQAQLRFIHVAGTNGKGSTCAFLEAIGRAAGLRTGLYTSPHLVSVTERIQVNRRPIDPAALVQGIERIAAAALAAGVTPTFFEFMTVVALDHFAAAGCEWVVWETGLGGRWDSTNIVPPRVCAITQIGLDHEELLGNTIARIAAEKAGIIKPAIPVVTSATDPAALAVIRETAGTVKAPFHVISPDEVAGLPVRPGLKGAHQRENAALAVAVAGLMRGEVTVPERAVMEGLERVRWPGRFEELAWEGERVILDGAHNPSGVEVLLRTLAEEYPGEPVRLVVGMMGDKDCERLCQRLATVAGTVMVVRPGGERSADPRRLAAAFEAAGTRGVTQAGSVVEALRMVRLRSGGPILVTGSLYLVGEALRLLDPGSFATSNDPELNEWRTPGMLGVPSGSGAFDAPGTGPGTSQT